MRTAWLTLLLSGCLLAADDFDHDNDGDGVPSQLDCDDEECRDGRVGDAGAPGLGTRDPEVLAWAVAAGPNARAKAAAPTRVMVDMPDFLPGCVPFMKHESQFMSNPTQGHRCRFSIAPGWVLGWSGKGCVFRNTWACFGPGPLAGRRVRVRRRSAGAHSTGAGSR